MSDWSGLWDCDNKKKIKINYEYLLLINSMLNDEIEKKILNEKKNIKGEILCNSGLLKPFN